MTTFIFIAYLDLYAKTQTNHYLSNLGGDAPPPQTTSLQLRHEIQTNFFA